MMRGMTSTVRAPRARRIASSRVRCPTRYASTLKMPTVARTTATLANSPITCVRNLGYANAESNNSSIVSNLTGTVGFASCRSARSVPASEWLSNEVRARMDSELPAPCVDAA